jgi:rod shape-determining protein MreD
MRSWILSTAAALCAFFVQVALGRWLAIAGVVPDLVLVAAVLLGLSRGPVTGTVIGFLGGFYQDLYDPSYLGLHSLVKTLAGFAAGIAGERLRKEQPLTQAAIFVVIACFHELLRTLLSLGPRMLSRLGPLLLHSLVLIAYTTTVGVAAGTLFQAMLFGRTRFAESVTARRRVR